MSQNKYMHPRNIYKNPPNFKQLAISYPEFRKFAKQNVTGKVTIDFKDKEALRALTSTLLQKDFGLHVEIPLNRLVPTLPLRLNYLLWIEDLLHLLVNPAGEQTRGVDIGTGASCIYPLLATKTKKWKMLSTELDHESVNCAKRNVALNGLEDFITVKQVEENTILKGALDMNDVYDFTMCNPPFFSSEREADSTNKSRSSSRTLPRNGKTGTLGEVVVQGGEEAFIQQMIQESAELRNIVKIYSTMVGCKSSVKILKSELDKVGVSSSTQTEFCQGHTTRWGLAWTFLPELNLEARPKNKSKKKEKPPMKHVVPMPADPLCYTVSIVTSKLKLLFTQLQIEHKELKGKKDSSVFEVSAQRNTWTHQRRKRREQKNYGAQQILQGNNSSETAATSTKEDCTVSINTESSPQNSRFIITDSPISSVKLQSQVDIKSMKRKGDDNGNSNKRRKGEEQECLQGTDCRDQTSNLSANELGFPIEGSSQLILSDSAESGNSKESQNLEIKDRRSDSYQENKNEEKTVQDSVSKNGCDLCSPQSLQDRTGHMTETNSNSCILKAMVSVSKVGPEIHIEMVWIEGTCGRDAVHQVLQHIKNNLKIE